MGTETMIFANDMKLARCSSCFCLLSPGEQVTEYAERQGSQLRKRYHHTDGESCREALNRESLRYARTPRARGNGTVNYENARDLR
jgi:hypothetical protein